MNVKYYLRDLKPEMFEAWMHFFKKEPDVDVSQGEIFDGPKADAIVSPANSFGFMDGGIDYVYSEFFGWDLEARLRQHLADFHDGELPVGEAVTVPTNHKDFPILISAPTMRVPTIVSGTVNAYLAFRAVVRIVKDYNLGAGLANPIRSVLCPGLGTAVGRMPYNVAAMQMFYAYRICEKKDPIKIPDLGVAFGLHTRLVNGVGSKVEMRLEEGSDEET